MDRTGEVYTQGKSHHKVLNVNEHDVKLRKLRSDQRLRFRRKILTRSSRKNAVKIL